MITGFLPGKPVKMQWCPFRSLVVTMINLIDIIITFVYSLLEYLSKVYYLMLLTLTGPVELKCFPITYIKLLKERK